MATREDTFNDEGSCWNRADEEEQMFILLGRDRHAPALIRLWAEMREKEGENPEVVQEARTVAQIMEDDLIAAGRVMLSLDAVSAFAASLKTPITPAVPEFLEQQSQPVTDTNVYNLRLGEIVVAGRGRPAKLIRVFGTDEQTDERVRGQCNIQVPGSKGPVTVEFAALRRALPEEIEAYRNSGGR